MNGMAITETTTRSEWYKHASMARILPFALFMAFIGIQELASFLAKYGIIPLYDSLPMVLYPVKAVVAGAALLFYASSYSELRLRDLANLQHSLFSFSTGILVFVLWINLDFSSGGEPRTFDPALFGSGLTLWVLIGFRLFGTAVVVPVMEELFWRSFFIRYLIDKDFEKIPIGLFSWSSFLICSVMFGLEHHLIIAGIVAGAAYNFLLYRTKSIAQCMLSHAITNLVLGIYVLATGQWQFW
jgi:uncharacterized protein